MVSLLQYEVAGRWREKGREGGTERRGDGGRKEEGRLVVRGKGYRHLCQDTIIKNERVFIPPSNCGIPAS